MKRIDLPSVCLGAVVALIFAVFGGFGHVAGDARGPASSSCAAQADCDDVYLATAVRYEQEWLDFIDKGLVLAGQPDFRKFVSDTTKRHVELLSASHSVQTNGRLASDERLSPASRAVHLEEFRKEAANLKKERAAYLYDLITGPLDSRLPDESIAELFAPRTP
jgi:hypothetical protein